MAQKRGPDWASGVGYERGSGNLAFEVEENTLEVVLVEDLLLLGSSQEQGWSCGRRSWCGGGRR